jgi:hypothetical protein
LSSDAAGLFILGIALSAATGGLVVLPRVEDNIARDSKLTAFERRHAADHRLGLDPTPFDAFRRQLQPRQPYSVDVPDVRLGPVRLGATVRAYSAFYFLPAIQAREAKPVFRYRFR